MKNTYSQITFFIVFVILISCGPQKQTKHIIVYGSSQCHHCVDFLQQLDSANMTYEFKDFMLAEKRYDEEMLKKLEAIDFRDYINLPVVEVEGQFFVEAKFDEVREAAFN